MGSDELEDRTPIGGMLTLERHVRVIVYLSGTLMGLIAIPLNDGQELYNKSNQFTKNILDMPYADAAGYTLLITGIIITMVTMLLVSYLVWRIWYRYQEKAV